jgi:hypothetical protein
VPERGRGADADAHHAVLLQREQRRPPGHAADVVLRAVDRVDDPAARAAPLGAELLPEDGVAGARGGEPLADELLGGLVGLGDRREVRLRLDAQVVGPEAAERDLVGASDELEGEGEVGVDAGTLFAASLRPEPTAGRTAPMCHERG